MIKLTLYRTDITYDYLDTDVISCNYFKLRYNCLILVWPDIVSTNKVHAIRKYRLLTDHSIVRICTESDIPVKPVLNKYHQGSIRFATYTEKFVCNYVKIRGNFLLMSTNEKKENSWYNKQTIIPLSTIMEVNMESTNINEKSLSS
jgi:hypothetical protein